jgi:archaellum component FlaC
MDNEMLAAISSLMDEKLNPIKDRLDRIEVDISEMKENLEEVRGATNYMAEWVDRLEKAVKAG